MSRKETVIPAGKFRAKCLALLELVPTDRLSLIVTKRGRPVARVVPLQVDGTKSLVVPLLDGGGLLDPIDVEWDAHAGSCSTLTRGFGGSRRRRS